jgi:hypothetical protein
VNEGVTVINSRIGCIVRKRSDRGYRFNTLLCFKQTGTNTYKPARASYLAVLDEIGIGIESFDKSGAVKTIFAKPEPHASSRPQVAGIATAMLGGVGQLRDGDAFYVAGTHIVCIAGRTVALQCGFLDSRGTVPRSYLLRLSDNVVNVDYVVSRAKGRTVLSRKQ